MKFKLVPDAINEVSETDVENAVCKYARTKGWLPRKYKTPGNRASMDRIFLKNKCVAFAEVKRSGKEPTKKQYEEIQKYKDMGFIVDWFDNVNDGKKFIDSIEEHFFG